MRFSAWPSVRTSILSCPAPTPELAESYTNPMAPQEAKPEEAGFRPQRFQAQHVQRSLNSLIFQDLKGSNEVEAFTNHFAVKNNYKRVYRILRRL